MGIPIAKSILLTGGIGDVIALESFFCDEQRKATETIYYATRAQKVIRQIFDVLPNYPKLKRHVILWEDFSKTFAFNNKNELVEHINPHQGSTEQDWQNRINNYQRWMKLLDYVEDYSIAIKFPRCNCYFHPYNGSSLLKYDLCDIFKFCLPGDGDFIRREERRVAHLMNLGKLSHPLSYIIICPYTVNDRRFSDRDFTQGDWEFVKEYLARKKCLGVVLNLGDDAIPEHPLIINLTNQTTFLESVEILKRAKGYIGIDSSLSVLATKLFKHPDLFIKSHNSHCYTWAGVYYAPQIDHPYLVRTFD